MASNVTICPKYLQKCKIYGAYLVCCREKPEETSHKKMCETYLPPANVENLQVPKTNVEVWELLHPGVKIVDASVQKIQSIQVAGLSAILKLLDNYGKDIGNLDEDQLQQLTDATNMACMAFSSMNQIRKDLIRNALGFPIAKFCVWDSVVGPDLLFPGLGKKVKERDETRINLKRRYR